MFNTILNRQAKTNLIILVVEDVHETRDGIEKLLKADGYRVALARDEPDAIKSVLLTRPDLILVSLAGLPVDVILAARRIRDGAEAGEVLPVVVFCVEGIGEGAEVAIGQNVHITRPDNFNQLRRLISRLLLKPADNLSQDEPLLMQSPPPLFMQRTSSSDYHAQDEKDKSAE